MAQRFHIVMDPATRYHPAPGVEYLHASENMSDGEVQSKELMLVGGWTDFVRTKILMPVSGAGCPIWKSSPCEIDGFIIYLFVGTVDLLTFKLLGAIGFTKGAGGDSEGLDHAFAVFPELDGKTVKATL
ncbi:hypothetical protein ONZ45_g7542 [Pleurotus djamor]|nr:hypothetical protein ONZ45_g7542 [Pleurotus djamor]